MTNSYTRFIILTEQRSGSIFLEMLLFSHPQIQCFGEIFNSNIEIRKKSRAKKLAIQDHESPKKFIEENIFTTYPEEIKAVGFRLFYTHARNLYWKTLWSNLNEMNVKVINLRRKNLLDQFTSLKVANMTDDWIRLKGENGGDPSNKIDIGLQEFVNYYVNMRWCEERAINEFQDNPFLIVYYEDLVNDRPATIKNILDFLKVKYTPLSSPTKKQESRKKADIIKNYDALMNSITKLSSFFDESGN